MIAQTSEIDQRIEQWHRNFEELRQTWDEWCLKNAVHYDSASKAWGAFVDEQRQRQTRIKSGNFMSKLMR